MESGEDETAVVPDLICLEKSGRNLVHELQLLVKGKFECYDGLVSVLPKGK